MERTRIRDIGITMLPDGGFLVRAPIRGLAARVPVHAVELLAYCSAPRTVGDVEQRFGPTGARLYRALTDVGLLVEPAQAAATPVMFENFASLDVHRRMLGDQARMAAYARAIAAVVRPGMAVMDAGTGSGILAALAARAGARVVYAVDNSDMIEVAEEVFRASGLADRVRPLRADVAEVQLPEPVDVVVTETFGAMALAEGGLDDLRACCERNLAPGGRVVPEGLSLHLAPVADSTLLEEAVGPFTPFEGVDLGVLRFSALHRGMTATITPDQLAHPGGVFARAPFPGEGRMTGRLTLEADGPIVGFAGWFTLHLAPGVDLGTGPADPPTHWRQQFFPVEPFESGGPLTLEADVGPAPQDRRGAEVRLAWSSDAGRGTSFHRVR